MSNITKDELAAMRQRCEAATKGPWRNGRTDTISFHGNGEGPYKNVYVDDPEGRLHMGERLPAIVCEVFDAIGCDCRDNAVFIAHAREDLPRLLDALENADREMQEWKRLAERCAEISIKSVSYLGPSLRQLDELHTTIAAIRNKAGEQ